MRKLSLLIPAAFLVAASPVAAHDLGSAAYPHIGGHYRHMHRDWSGIGGRGHVHSICWRWDNVEGWEWVCR